MIIPGLRTPPADTEKAVTDDYVKAVNLNYHIKAAAQVAQQSLYEMCKGFKEMRDSKLYKELGYSDFEEYCEKETQMSRQSIYKYISIIEKLPAEFVASGRQIGMKKLHLLSTLSEEERTEITEKTDLENTSVRELEQQIRQIRAEKDKAVADKSAAEAEASAAAQQAKSLEKAKNALSQQIAALEASGVVLKSVRMVQDTVMGAWNRYLDLVDVREENDELKKQVEQLRHKLLMASEERAELVRLRRLLTLTPPEGWQTLGARVLAGRMGANSALASVLIGRGYMTGAIPGTPVMTPQGVAGRVLRAGPSSATVLLLVDPGSRIAVISQESRIQGVLVGGGPDKPLEMRFVSHNDVIRAGEILVTSGLDDAFPKGIPVARVLSATPSDLSPFQSIQAAPLAALSDLEELLLISRVEGSSVSGSLSGVLEAPRSPSSDSAGSPAAQRAQPQPGQQGSTIPGPPRPDAPFFLSGPTPPPGLPLRSRP